MGNEFVTTMIISRFVAQSPTILIWIIGFSLSLYFRKKDPQKYLLTTIAFVIFFLDTIGNSVFSIWISTTLAIEGEPLSSGMGFGHYFMSFLSTLGDAIAWAILFFAIFGQKFKLDEGIAQ
jgi:hypothetical protein